MKLFLSRLFGPTLPDNGMTVNGEWQSDGRLRIISTEGEQEAADLTITASGFNSEILKISWEDEAGEYALIIDNASARDLCRSSAPPEFVKLIDAADRCQKAVDYRFRLGGFACIILLLFPLILLSLFYLNRESLTDWLIQHVSVQQEEKIGEAVLIQSRLSMQLIESGPAVDSLRNIGEKLTVDSPRHYRWFVANQAEINAFAAPGGVVVVNAGLLRAVTTPEELAGVLAHEIAHAELRHSLKVMAKGAGLRALISFALGDYGGSFLAEGVKKLGELGFSREAEREADQEGLRRLVAAQIDPQGMIRFFELLEKAKLLSSSSLFSTHPATAERIEALKKDLSRLKKTWHPLEINLVEIRSELPPP